MTRQLELVVQGVLGTTPVVSRAPSGRAYCRFRLATTPTFRTSEGHNLGSEAPVEPLDESDVKNTELNVSRKTAK